MKSLLINPQQAHIYINQTAWPWIKSMLIAGHRLEFLNASAAIYGIRVPAPKYLEAA